MGRRKKQTRKFKPRNEFRYGRSYTTQGHPQYIFGETPSGKLKSFSLTHTPNDKYVHYPLSKNPNPNDKDSAHIQDHVHTGPVNYYSKDALEGWSFAKEDMPIVRHIKKKYKKSSNRKPKKKPPKK